MLSVFSCDQGEYQFLRQIALEQFHFASALDILDGKILVGHENGKIQTVNVDGTKKNVCLISTLISLGPAITSTYPLLHALAYPAGPFTF